MKATHCVTKEVQRVFASDVDELGIQSFCWARCTRVFASGSLSSTMVPPFTDWNSQDCL